MDKTLYSKEIQLEFPIKDGAGKEIRVLHLRRPKVRDLKQAQRAGGAEVDQMPALVSVVAFEDVLPEDIEDMDLGDFGQVSGWFRSILGDTGLADKGGTHATAGTARQVVPVSTQRD